MSVTFDLKLLGQRCCEFTTTSWAAAPHRGFRGLCSPGGGFACGGSVPLSRATARVEVPLSRRGQRRHARCPGSGGAAREGSGWGQCRVSLQVPPAPAFSRGGSLVSCVCVFPRGRRTRTVSRAGSVPSVAFRFLCNNELRLIFEGSLCVCCKFCS